MVGDPYTIGCRKAVECQINDDCPKSAKCVHENGEPKCRDVCEGVTCGRNAECSSDNHASFCICRDGYDGNPKDRVQGCKPIPKPCQNNNECPNDAYCNVICKPLCHADAECQLNEVCMSNQCINPCEISSSSCGLNAECVTNNHVKSKTSSIQFIFYLLNLFFFTQHVHVQMVLRVILKLSVYEFRLLA